jgi:ketosteroid isomerase-like protein
MAKRKARKASTARSAKRRTAKKPARKAKKRAGARSAAARGGNDLRTLARRIVAVTTANDDEATLALYATDVESKEQGQPPMHGIDGIRQKFVGWRNMVSAAQFEPRRVVVDGNTIVIEWVGEVTLAASGKQAQLHEVAIHEIEDGKIKREAFFYDPSALS